MTRLRAVLALVVAMTLAGCSGDGDAPVAPSPQPTTTPRTEVAEPALSEEDRELALDIADGLRTIGAVSFTAGGCNAEPSCLDGVRERMGDVAESELVGLQARVNRADLACVRDTGAYYLLALEAYVLGRDFVRDGDRRRALDVLRNATEDITKARATAADCTPEGGPP